MKLTDRDWKEFFIGGEQGIFDISSTCSGIDKNKLTNVDNNKIIPYITRTDIQNGVNMFIGTSQDYRYQINKGNVITIGLDTQTVFYQPHDFFTGQNIQILSNLKLNQLNALFIIPLLKVQLKKLNWGGNGATLGRLLRIKIMLPITPTTGNPDWDFMQNYSQEKLNSKTLLYNNFIKVSLSQLNYSTIVPLNEKEWKEFYLTDLFPIIQRGKRLTKVNQKKGNIPYVSSTSLNNGVDNFISNRNKVRIFRNCVTIANSGSVGSSFYQPYEFIASDHVTHLENPQMNKYIYLFICTLLKRLSSKYNFNREINDKRISREKIMLPTNVNDKPDFDYMEQYVKNLLFIKYKAILERNITLQ